MSLDLKQSLKLTQHLLMTPQLQQAIKLLQLSRVELEEFLANQIVENPVLEDFTPEISEKPNKDESEAVPDVVDKNSEGQDYEYEDFRNLGDQYLSLKVSSRSNIQSPKDDDFNYENVVSKPKTLYDHLMTQVGEIQFEKQELEIAHKIIGNITDDGYLDLNLEDFCKEENYDIELTEGVLDTIQRLDPSGVGARDLSECLNIQLRESGLKNGVVEKIVSEHLKELETRNYNVISKKLGISIDDIYQNVAIIVGLNPTPGRDFGENNAQTVIPDVYVFKVSDKWAVSLNEDNIPALRVSSFYQERSDSSKRGEEKNYLQDKIKSANWLIKSIQQRQRTIRKVAECIVEKQYEFLEKGIRFLKPMVLRDVAEAVEMHESTISRVTNSKYMHTPRGIFELKFFFSSSIKSDDDDVSSSFVKSIIKEIISGENEKKPFSDQKIVSLLSEKGVHLARRTVAKYREQIGILPSSKRRKYF